MTELLAEVQSLRSERIHWQQSELAAQTQLLKARQDAEQWAEKAHQLGNEVRRRKQSEAELRQACIQKDAELSSYFARIRQLEAQLGLVVLGRPRLREPRRVGVDLTRGLARDLHCLLVFQHVPQPAAHADAWRLGVTLFVQPVWFAL